MMSYDEFMKNYGILSEMANTPDYEEEDKECVEVDLTVLNGALTFKLNNYELTQYTSSLKEFKEALFEDIEMLLDECIMESLGGRG